MLKRRVRSIVVRLAVYPLVVYFTAAAILYFKQDLFIFPAPERYEKQTPGALGLPFENFRIPLNATDSIHAWFIPAAIPSEVVTLAFHGNSYVLEDMVAEELTKLHEIGTNLLLVDYRGYGSSTAVTPNETTINDDARAALTYLLRYRKVPVTHVYLLGRSVGSGPAVYLGVINPDLGGVILESPFSSIHDAADASWYFRIFPLTLMLQTHFANFDRIASVRCPLLIVSGTADTIAPEWMSRKLFYQAGQPKELYLVPGAGHNDLLEFGGVALTQTLRRFIGATHAKKPEPFGSGSRTTDRSLTNR